jgi:hypothetical protein
MRPKRCTFKYRSASEGKRIAWLSAQCRHSARELQHAGDLIRMRSIQKRAGGGPGRGGRLGAARPAASRRSPLALRCPACVVASSFQGRHVQKRKNGYDASGVTVVGVVGTPRRLRLRGAPPSSSALCSRARARRSQGVADSSSPRWPYQGGQGPRPCHWGGETPPSTKATSSLRKKAGCPYEIGPAHRHAGRSAPPAASRRSSAFGRRTAGAAACPRPSVLASFTSSAPGC